MDSNLVFFFSLNCFDSKICCQSLSLQRVFDFSLILSGTCFPCCCFNIVFCSIKEGRFSVVKESTHPLPAPPLLPIFLAIKYFFFLCAWIRRRERKQGPPHTFRRKRKTSFLVMGLCACAGAFLVLTKSFPSRRRRRKRCSEVRARRGRERERETQKTSSFIQGHSVNKLDRGLDVVVFFCCRFFFLIVLLSSLHLFQPCRMVSFCTTCRRRSPCLIRWLLLQFFYQSCKSSCLRQM